MRISFLVLIINMLFGCTKGTGQTNKIKWVDADNTLICTPFVQVDSILKSVIVSQVKVKETSCIYHSRVSLSGDTVLINFVPDSIKFQENVNKGIMGGAEIPMMIDIKNGLNISYK